MGIQPHDITVNSNGSLLKSYQTLRKLKFGLCPVSIWGLAGLASVPGRLRDENYIGNGMPGMARAGGEVKKK
jgi:hypothetical protein